MIKTHNPPLCSSPFLPLVKELLHSVRHTCPAQRSIIRERYSHAARSSHGLKHQPFTETCGESKNAASTTGYWAALRGATVSVDRNRASLERECAESVWLGAQRCRRPCMGLDTRWLAHYGHCDIDLLQHRLLVISVPSFVAIVYS